VPIDEVADEGAVGRSFADAPDGAVMLEDETELAPGDIVRAQITSADEYDLWGALVRPNP